MKDDTMYKGFTGSVHFDAGDKLFHGKLEGIQDLVTFEGETASESGKAFQDAVEDYLVLCEEAKKTPKESAF